MAKIIRAEFEDDGPNGLRLFKGANLTVQCITCTRDGVKRLPSSDRAKIDRPGVYALIGTGEPEYRLYIGQADSVGDRLGQHLRDSNPWKLAVAFCKAPDDFNDSEIRDLEATLIDLAGRARLCNFENKVEPNRRPQGEAATNDHKQYLDQIFLFFNFLGYEFFTVPTVPASPATDPLEAAEPPRVASDIVAALNALFTALPSTECYRTNTPDSRAKVVAPDKRFRVIARIAYRKQGVNLKLTDIGSPPQKYTTFKIHDPNEITPDIQGNIRLAHERAMKYLGLARSAASAN